MRRLLALLLLATSLSLIPSMTAGTAAATAGPPRLSLYGPGSAELGDPVILAGNARKTAPGTVVTLQKRVDGRWRPIKVARVWRQFGHYRFAVKPARGTHYYRAAVGRMVSTTEKLVITRQRCRLSAYASFGGFEDKHVVSGRLLDCRSGQSLRLRRQTYDGWRYLSVTAQPDITGRFTFRFFDETPSGTFQVVKPADRTSGWAVSRLLERSLSPQPIQVDGPVVTVPFSPTVTTRELRFTTSAPSISIASAAWIHVYDERGRMVSGWPGGSERFLLPRPGTYTVHAKYQPRQRVNIGVQVMTTPIREAHLGGPEVSLPATPASIRRFVSFTGHAGQLVSTSVRLGCPTLRTASGQLVARYGRSGGELWQLPTDGSYELATTCSQPSGAQAPLTLGLRTSVEYDAEVDAPAARAEFTQSRQIQVFRFHAEPGRTLTLRQSAPNSTDHWMIVDPSGQVLDDRYRSDGILTRLEIKTAGTYAAILRPLEDATGAAELQVCTTRETSAVVGGEPVEVQDSTSCPASQVIVNFHAEAGDHIGATVDGPQTYRGCFVRNASHARVGSCEHDTALIPTSGDYQMVLGTFDLDPLRLHLWRADHATAVYDGEPVTVTVSKPRQAAVVTFDVPLNASATLSTVATALGSEAPEYVVRVLDQYGNLVDSYDEVDGKIVLLPSTWRTRYTAQIFPADPLVGDLTFQVSSG